jgi:multidrug resistance efflux pump
MPAVEEEKIIDLDEQSEFIKEAMAQPPQWIFKYGMFLFFGLICVILILSNFIKYPDVLRANITLTTLNPPATLIAKTNGKLTDLLVTNNAIVKKCDVLGVIENTANCYQLLSVEKIVDSLIYLLRTKDSISITSLSDTLNLGDITPQYLLFLKSYKDYHLFTEINPQAQEIKVLDRQLAEYAILLSKYKKEEEIFQEEYLLVEKDYNRDLGLFKQNVISAREFETKKKECLSSQRNFENQKIITSNTKITVNNIEKNKIQLKIQEYQERSKYKQDLEQSIKSLQTSINTWKTTYLLESPISGKVSFFNYWSVNQNIKTGDAVFSIVPTEQQELVAKLILPSQNSGKVKVGQRVNIKLDNYPYTEYGMLNGIVKNISLVPNNSNYAVDVELVNGLITSYNKALTYKEEMTGTAEIITDNLSILDRIFMNLKKTVVK